MEKLGQNDDNAGEKMSKKSLEDSLNKLEEIVGQLESGELGLDQSIKEFEKGIKLYKDCQTLLSSAEKKIKILTDSLNEENYEG